MLSKTLQDGLNDYGIGAKIHALRVKKKVGLVDPGKHTGLSPALLSKIERGRLFPTLPTLLRIALTQFSPCVFNNLQRRVIVSIELCTLSALGRNVKRFLAPFAFARGSSASRPLLLDRR